MTLPGTQARHAKYPASLTKLIIGDDLQIQETPPELVCYGAISSISLQLTYSHNLSHLATAQPKALYGVCSVAVSSHLLRLWLTRTCGRSSPTGQAFAWHRRREDHEEARRRVCFFDLTIRVLLTPEAYFTCD